MKKKRITFVENEIARFETNTLCDKNDDNGKKNATPYNLYNKPLIFISIYVWKKPFKNANLGYIANGAEFTRNER